MSADFDPALDLWNVPERDWDKPHLIEGLMKGHRTWFLWQPPGTIKTFRILVAAQLYCAEKGIEIAFISPMSYDESPTDPAHGGKIWNDS